MIIAEVTHKRKAYVTLKRKDIFTVYEVSDHIICILDNCETELECFQEIFKQIEKESVK